MRKKNTKRIVQNIEPEIINVDSNKIYIYIRDWKKLNPVPYVFNLELNKLKRILKNI